MTEYNPIKIFIGTEEKTRIPCKVLQHSILKRTQNPIEFVEMEGESWVQMNKRELGVGTGFSLMRWTIAERCNFEGFAIYLDADQICLKDISHLYTQDVDKPVSSIYCTYQQDKWYAKAPNTSVMLINCEYAKDEWMSLKEIKEFLKKDCPKRKLYAQLMHGLTLKTPPVEIPKYFNHLNIANDDTVILHYTTENQQPWYNPSHPYRYLWRQALQEALKDEVVHPAEILDEVKRFKKHTRTERGQGMHPYWKKFAK